MYVKPLACSQQNIANKPKKSGSSPASPPSNPTPFSGKSPSTPKRVSAPANSTKTRILKFTNSGHPTYQKFLHAQDYHANCRHLMMQPASWAINHKQDFPRKLFPPK